SDNEELFRIMYGNTVGDYSDYPVLKTAADETVMIMQSVIEECQKKKLIRKADPKELAMSAWVLVHGLSTLIIERKFHFSQWNPANLRTEVLRLQKNFYSGIRNRR
ncbi:MAG TPA: WHG domain-containing protein, partial [Leptospiraceae bacterium]|nr:WHG domain-containing protein [Leptospiraceae bacterium]